MNIKIMAPNDLLFDLVDALPNETIVARDISEGLELGESSWIELDVEKIKSAVSFLVEKITAFLGARPRAEISIGDVSITLENVSEESINMAIDKAIAASSGTDT